MLTRSRLVELAKEHEGERVLSAYLGRDGADPGARASWRLRLEGALDAARVEVQEQTPDELAAFERARESLTHELDGFGRVFPAEGWVGFASPNGFRHAELLPYAPIDLVRWRDGVQVAPYVRALKSVRPITVALVDGFHARVLRWVDGQLTEIEGLEGQRQLADAADVGVSKRASSTTGVRGLTRTEFTQRTLEEESKRVRRDAVASILDAVIGESGVVLGGTAKAVAAFRADLEKTLAGRVVEVSELGMGSSDAQIAAAVASAASELTLARQRRLLEICREAPDHASLGWNPTRRALEMGAVGTLLVARGVIESLPDDVEALVRSALAQGADVEELGNELGASLSAEAEGIAARLRFPVPG